MDEIIIHSLQDYINVIEKIPFDFCLSRGQSLDKKLLPTALRFDEDNKRLYSKSKERQRIIERRIH